MNKLILIPLGVVLAALYLSCSGAEKLVHNYTVGGQVVESDGAQKDAGWPATIPQDAVQPGELVDNLGMVIPDHKERSADAVESTQFSPGKDRFSGGGMVADNGEAATIAGFEGSVSYAIYRLPLGGDEPGFVDVDANAQSPEGYFVGLADYGRGAWEWNGPFTENHVRLSRGNTGGSGADYTSTLGSVFVCVVAGDGALVDVVGVGASPRDAGDDISPAAPGTPVLEPYDGALLVHWDAVGDGDLAGYRVYWCRDWFYDGTGTGVRQNPALVDHEAFLIRGLKNTTSVRISAVDVSGNESPLSGFAAAAPLSGNAYGLAIGASSPSTVIGQTVEVTASGADSYDFDIDGDGAVDLTGIMSGVAFPSTATPRLARITAWGHADGGNALACGGVSVLVIDGDATNEAPAARLQIGQQICLQGEEVTFDASPSYDTDGSIVLYEFDFNGDGYFEQSSPTDSTVLHSYATPGIYTATVRVTDDGGARDTASKPVRVNEVFDSPHPWPNVGGNLRRNGRATFDGPQVSNKRWSYPTYSIVHSSPAVAADGTVYFGCDDDYLYALDSAGALKWKYLTGGNVSSSPAIAPNGTIYVGSWDGMLHAVILNGSGLWKFPTGGAIESSPLVGPDGTIYVGSNDQHLYAITPLGKLKWSFATEGWVVSSPTLGVDGTVYFGCRDDKLYALTPDGKLKWAIRTNDDVDSSPAVGTDGTIYFGSWDHYLYAISPDGELEWSYKTGSNIDSSPAIGADGTVYICSRNHKLYAIKPDGTFKWQYITLDGISSSPVIGGDGTIYLCSADHYLYAIAPNGGLRWSYHTGGEMETSPALGADGTLYVPSSDLRLYAIGL